MVYWSVKGELGNVGKRCYCGGAVVWLHCATAALVYSDIRVDSAFL